MLGSSFRARLPLTISWLGCAALVVLVLLTGHSDAVDAIQDNAAFPAGPVAASGIGQTFVSRYPNLHAVEVRWIVSDDLQAPSASRAVMHLYRAGDTREIATAALLLRDIRHNEYSKFVFAPLPDSEGASFHFTIDVPTAEIQRGYLSLWTSGEDSYADGQMIMQAATDRDLDFRTYYEPDAPMLLWALVRMLTQYGAALLIALPALLIPGVGLLLLANQWRGLDGWALAGAAGLALLSAASLVQIILPVPAGAMVLALGGVAIAWRAWRAVRGCRRREFGSSFRTSSSTPGACGRPDPSLRDSSLELASPAKPHSILALALFFLLAFAVSLLQIRDVQVPLWVDSTTHAGIIQTLLVNGRLPADNFYHLGYDATAALVTQLTGLSVPQTMLLLGQLLVLQVGLSVFALTRRLLASNTVGIAGAVAVWFLSPTPSYFVTWGRYPLLMGSAILPLALYAAIELIESPHWNRRAIGFAPAGFAAVCLAGLAFAHVRLAAFYGVFITVYLLYFYLCRTGKDRRRHSLFRMTIILGAGVAFGLAWLALLLLRGLSWQAVLFQSSRLSSPDLAGAVAVLALHHGPALWLLASAGLVVGILRREASALICLAWFTALLAIAALPPDKIGGEYLSPGLVLLMLYLPAAILAAEVIHWLYDRWAMGSAAARAAWRLALIVVALSGARDMVSIVNPATVLFSSSDEQAMEWIKDNTPAQAKFLVNSFLWTSTDYALADGGGWIPYVAGRPIVWQKRRSSPTIAAGGADFIYLGWRSGVRTRAEFACQPDRYRLVYNQGGVAIFQVDGDDKPLDTVPSRFACDLQG